MDWPLEMSPQELQTLLEKGQKIALIDVREPQEFAVSRIEEFQLMPMQTVPSQLQRLQMLAAEDPIAILCHHGVRSLNVAMWLRQQGIANCFSVSGGIDRWSQEVDPSVPRY